MLYAVIQCHAKGYPVMLATFFMKYEALDFVKNHILKDILHIIEVDSWEHWSHIRNKANAQFLEENQTGETE